MKSKILHHMILISLVSCSNPGSFTINDINEHQGEPVDYVDPMIGSSNGGNTFPGAVVPWGMVHAAPHTSRDKSKSGSRYFHGDNFIYGFGQVHASGDDCSSYANINLMPTVGPVFEEYYKNRSRYNNETSKAGFYSVFLLNQEVRVEISATVRSTISRFTFPSRKNDANILVDVSEGLSQTLDAHVQVLGKNYIQGWVKAKKSCIGSSVYTLYFFMEFNKKSIVSGTWKGKTIYKDVIEQEGDSIGAFLSFGTGEKEQILVKTGFSYVSIKNAQKNLETEIPGWQFERIVKEARDDWNAELKKIDIGDASNMQKTKFYTALYHSLLHPNIVSDVNGEFLLADSIETVPEGENQYSVFAFEKTYRTLHPLLNLVYPARQSDILRSITRYAKIVGRLPCGEPGSAKRLNMNGDPSPIIIADSYFKGIDNFDARWLYQVMYKEAIKSKGNHTRPLNYYVNKYGFIPWDDCGPGDLIGKPRMVSEGLGYAYADWVLAKLSRELGNVYEAKLMEERASKYLEYFDKKTGFMRPRYKNGKWYEGFHPGNYNGEWVNMGFERANSWQYTFFSMFDKKRFIELHGGREQFVNRLQKVFDERNFDISKVADWHYPYLFTYVTGQEWRTQRLVREILSNEFNIGSGGIPGSDHYGALSSWYVFSAIGFYPICPGKAVYHLGSPILEKVTIKLDTSYFEGEQFIVSAPGNYEEKVFIKGMFLNGKQQEDFFLDHEDIVRGGVLKLEMAEALY